MGNDAPMTPERLAQLQQMAGLDPNAPAMPPVNLPQAPQPTPAFGDVGGNDGLVNILLRMFSGGRLGMPAPAPTPTPPAQAFGSQDVALEAINKQRAMDGLPPLQQ